MSDANVNPKVSTPKVESTFVVPQMLWEYQAVVIENGYRHIDTAQWYGNEHIIGEFLDETVKSGKLKREDIFITSKLALSNHQPELAEKSIKESLRKLQTEYIDCFLIHWPTPLKPIPGPELSFQELFAKFAKAVVIENGYRHIDTAQWYGNEHIIGEFLDETVKSGKLKREDIFITSKLALSNHQPELAEKSIKESLRKLQTEYIDCFLIHWPTPLKPIPGPELSFQELFAKFAKGEIEFDLTPHIETWKVLEKFYKQGVFKVIGISNFNEEQIQDLYDKAEVKPQNLQVKFFLDL
uniref:NADP-dependent oxidoreductase domain-containing protein n=1 Tax=Acrobeloides nanus TaxID=290746 RepID=A0A914DJK2_9BILA